MSEIDVRAAYEAVLAELERQVPDLHAQVLDEIRRGRELKASDISGTEKTSRNKELASQKLGRLSDADLAVVEFTPEERLMVVVRAISVATETYNASAETLSRFGSEFAVDRIDFESPGADGSDPALDAEAEESGEPESDGQPDRSAFVISEDSVTVNRDAINLVLEALDTGDEHN